MAQYPHGVVDASNQGTAMTAEGAQFIWWAHGKSKLADGGKIKGMNRYITTILTTKASYSLHVTNRSLSQKSLKEAVIA